MQTQRLGILLASTILTVPHLVARTTESSAAVAPAPRYAHQMMTYDDDRGRVLLFGGAGQDDTFGDFWSRRARVDAVVRKRSSSQELRSPRI